MLDSTKPDLNTELTIYCTGIQDYKYWQEKLKQNETKKPH